MYWYFKVITSALDFDSRARRKEFWMFVLFNLLIALALTLIDFVFGTYNYDRRFGIITGVYQLFVLIPAIAVSIRRLHDCGKRGWFLAIGLIPLIGTLILLYYFVKDGEKGPNRYGADPKEVVEGELVDQF